MNACPPITPDAHDEAARTAVLAAHHPATLDGSAALRQITDFAARLCGTRTALVSLVDDHRQFFLARTGLAARETPREQSFCAHAMWQSGVMIVPDATADARFADNPLVSGEMQLRFYAGAPLISDDGYPLGSLCVIDDHPRPEGLTALQREGLEVLAAGVRALLRDTREGFARRESEREARAAANDSELRFRTLADTMPQMVWSTLPDGFHDYYNARWYDFTGAPRGRPMARAGTTCSIRRTRTVPGRCGGNRWPPGRRIRSNIGCGTMMAPIAGCWAAPCRSATTRGRSFAGSAPVPISTNRNWRSKSVR